MMGGGARKEPERGDGLPEDHQPNRETDLDESQTAGDQEGARHTPVLLPEVLAHLKPAAGELYLDGTFGAGGYTRGILEAADCSVIGVDRDPNAAADAVDFVIDYAPRFSFHKAEFSRMAEVVAADDLVAAAAFAAAMAEAAAEYEAGNGNNTDNGDDDASNDADDAHHRQVGNHSDEGGGGGNLGDDEPATEGEAAQVACLDGIVLDLGVSSMQLDEAGRGFSFMRDGPLDMRMGCDGPSAADVLASADEADIADILYYLGDERRSRAIARAIVNQRADEPLTTTLQLADLVGRVLGHRKSDPKHPATRTFQALRIYVNDELGELAEGLRAAERLLKPGGRLVVVTFHSLEDRIVKRFFQERSGKTDAGSRHLPAAKVQERPPSFQFVNRRPVSPNKTETNSNPRARSAKLRAVLRTKAPAWDDGDLIAGIPRLPKA